MGAPKTACWIWLFLQTGDFSRFPAAVLELVGKSQTSKKFIVTAFRQRRAGLSLSIHGEEFQDETVRFHMLPSQSHDGKFDLTIFMGKSSLDSEQLARAAFILLDTTIGEYDMETLIGAVEVCRLPPASDGQLLPLSELPRISWMKVRCFGRSTRPLLLAEFVIITPNTVTMARMNRLFGVTTAGPGVWSALTFRRPSASARRDSGKHRRYRRIQSPCRIRVRFLPLSKASLVSACRS